MSIKSKTNSVTLAGAYAEITDTAVPLFKSLQFENNTGGDILVKFNSDSDARTYKDGEQFLKVCDTPRETFSDKIYANGTGTILVEIEYYT